MAKAISERHEIVVETDESGSRTSRAHNRSPEAIQMRLERMGLVQRS